MADEIIRRDKASEAMLMRRLGLKKKKKKYGGQGLLGLFWACFDVEKVGVRESLVLWISLCQAFIPCIFFPYGKKTLGRVFFTY